MSFQKKATSQKIDDQAKKKIKIKKQNKTQQNPKLKQKKQIEIF